MRTPRNGGQLESLINAIRLELAKRIAEAETRGDMPDEASILIETRATIVFGGSLTRQHAKERWLKAQSGRMPAELAKELKRSGAVHAATVVDKTLHIHAIHEMVDVHMTAEAAKRLSDARREAAAEAPPAEVPDANVVNLPGPSE